MATKNTPNNYQGVDTTSNYNLITKFLGYRSREDVTTLPPGYMIPGSQNVLINTSGRLQSRKGYTVDGTNLSDILPIYPIYGMYDWPDGRQGMRNLRACNNVVQDRFINADNTVDWYGIVDITAPAASGGVVDYTNYWDSTNLLNVLLFVDGSTKVYKWSGGSARYLSYTSSTITIDPAGKYIDTPTWVSAGFNTGSEKKLMMNGVEYTYTGGEATATLTGVTPDPTLATPTGNTIVYQSVVVNASVTGQPITNIENLRNQIYYGNSNSNVVYVSQAGTYTNVTPGTAPGDPVVLTFSSPLRALVVQEDTMYIATGFSKWNTVSFTLSGDLLTEKTTITPLKTALLQGALFQNAVDKNKNDVVFLSHEPRLLSLGRTVNILGTPMITDLSIPVVNDFDNLKFIPGVSWVKYYKTYIYVGLPNEGLMYIYNMTDPDNPFWEAPQVGAFSGASISPTNQLILHSYFTDESYIWQSSYSDNGNPIECKAKFAYNDYGKRYQSKTFNEFWIDGYITHNTELDIIYNLDLEGCATTINKTFSGTSSNVCSIPSDGSLGKTSLGKKGLGTNSVATGEDPLPPYFKVIKVNSRKDFYLFSPEFYSYGPNYHWELLSFGPLVTSSMYGNNILKEE